jgi:hypothetical protein
MAWFARVQQRTPMRCLGRAGQASASSGHTALGSEGWAEAGAAAALGLPPLVSVRSDRSRADAGVSARARAKGRPTRGGRHWRWPLGGAAGLGEDFLLQLGLELVQARFHFLFAKRLRGTAARGPVGACAGSINGSCPSPTWTKALKATLAASRTGATLSLEFATSAAPNAAMVSLERAARKRAPAAST